MSCEFPSPSVEDEPHDLADEERRERREAQIRRKELQEKRSAEAAVKARRRRRLFFAAVVVVVAAGFLVGRSIVDIIRLRREKAEAEARLEALKVRIELLESELQRVTSDEYIEQQARTHLRMIYPGETVYIVVPPEETSGNKAAN